MERLDEVKKGQGAEREVKMSGKKSRNPPSDFNPFLIEPILRKLLKKIDTVAQLKELRKICRVWDKVNLEELEDRAFKGKLKAIDFEWNRYQYRATSSKKLAEKELVQFLKDTRSIPQLFHSFKFNIPESLKIIQDYTSAFFSNYHIYGVELVTYHNYKNFRVSLNYFLSLIGPNLKNLKICQCCASNTFVSFEPESPKWPKPKKKLVLHKLEKLIIENNFSDKDLIEFFKSILSTESGHITSLKLNSLPGADIGSFPGLDPTRMTRLDIGVRYHEGCSFALKYITGLMILVEQGMRLKDLGFKFDSCVDSPASYAQNLPSICFNMTHFFASQSSTLTTLDFQLKFFAVWPGSEDEIGAEVETYGKIQLPVFKALHTISFEHRLKMGIAHRKLAFSLFQTTHSLPLHFPSLVNVTFDSECSMGLFFDNPGPMDLAQESRFHFKRLEIIQIASTHYVEHWNKESRGNWDMLYGSLIGSVDYLWIPSQILEQARIPWGDSLREMVLFIRNLNGVYSGTYKLAHLKKLETLVIQGYQRIGYEKIVWDDKYQPTPQENVTEYLNSFSEATQLNLTYIKFFGLDIVEDGSKEDFIRYFPFPAYAQY